MNFTILERNFQQRYPTPVTILTIACFRSFNFILSSSRNARGDCWGFKFAISWRWKGGYLYWKTNLQEEETALNISCNVKQKQYKITARVTYIWLIYCWMILLFYFRFSPIWVVSGAGVLFVRQMLFFINTTLILE